MSGRVTLKWNNSAVAKISTNAVKGLARMAADIASQGRRNAPYKTGALRNSIRITNPKGNTIEVVAGGNYHGRSIPYAAIQEYGGMAGRGHSVHIVGKHYMERAAKSVMSGNYIQRYFRGVA